MQRQGQDGEGGEVGHGVEQAEPGDEPQQLAGAELGRTAQRGPVRAVVDEGELGGVEAQVLRQHLDREHRQERQQQPRGEHRDHVAEVRGEGDAQIGGDVGTGVPARADRVGDRGEVLLGEHHVRALPGHVGGVARGDADVGRAQGGQVVDAVAEEPHGVPGGPQRPDDPGLVRGGAAGEDRRTAGQLGEFGVGEPVHAVGGEHGVVGGEEAEVTADAGRGARVVAGEDLDGDALSGEDVQRVGGRGRERVPEGHQAAEGEPAFVGRGGLAGACGALRGGDREDAYAALGLCGGEVAQPYALVLVEYAALQDRLDVTLDRQRVPAEAAGRTDDGGGQPAERVEGDGRRPVVCQERVLVGRVQDRLVQGVRYRQVGEVQGPPGVDGGPVQDVRVVPAVHSQGAVDDGAVLGEGAGLVQAQDVDGAHVVQRRQPFDDHPVRAGQQRGAAGQAGGDQDRQHLRRQPDRHGDGERQRLQAPAAQRRVGHQHQRRGEQHEPDQRPGDAVHRPVEGARLLRAAVRVPGVGEPGARAGRGDDGPRAAGGDAAALEAQLRLLEHAALGRARGVVGVLGDGHRLARERGLVHREPARPQQPQVRRDQFTRAEADDVPRYQFFHGHLAGRGRRVPVPPAQHRGGGGDQLAQSGRGPVGAVLPGRAQHAAHHDQQEDHRGGSPGEDGGRHQPEAPQDRGERVAEAAYEQPGPGHRAPCRERVRARPGQPLLRLCLRQSARAAVQPAQHLQHGRYGGRGRHGPVPAAWLCGDGRACGRPRVPARGRAGVSHRSRAAG